MQFEFDFEDDEDLIQVEVVCPEELPERDADSVLDFAMGKLKRVLVIGRDSSGEWYFASDSEDGYELNYMTDVFKRFIMRQMNG